MLRNYVQFAESVKTIIASIAENSTDVNNFGYAW